jgi:hypothetical protein
MPQRIEVPGMGIVEFPDGMTDDQIATAIKRNMPAEDPRTWVQKFVQNLGAGAVRGAGSIGATLLTPVDAAARAMGVQNDFIGRTDRREAMDAALKGVGADPDSLAFGGGKLGAEVAGTLGVGGLLAKPIAAALPRVAQAITTGGFSTGAAPGAADLALRSLGGGVTGAASAGLINPDDAVLGGGMGAALPGALKVAGGAGSAVGGLFKSQKAKAAEELATALQFGTKQDIAAAVARLKAAETFVEGSTPTVSQALQSPQAAILERVVGDSSGGAYLKETAQRQNAARLGALEKQGAQIYMGAPKDEATLVGNKIGAVLRTQAADDQAVARQAWEALYGQAKDEGVKLQFPLSAMEGAMEPLGRGTVGAGKDARAILSEALNIGQIELPAVKQAGAGSSMSLAQAVRKAGGLSKVDASGLMGEVKGVQGDFKNLVRVNGGLSPARMAERMYEAGYLPNDDAATLIGALRDEATGGRVVSAADDLSAFARARDAAMGDLPQAEKVPIAVPFDEFQRLRRSAGALGAKVGAQEGGAAESMVLGDLEKLLAGRVDDAAGGNLLSGESMTPGFRDKYVSARDMTRANAERYSAGNNIEQILRKPYGQNYSLGGDEITNKLWHGGAGLADDVANLKQVLTANNLGPVFDDLRKFIMTDAAGKVTAGGNLSAALPRYVESRMPGLKEALSDEQLLTLKAIVKDIQRAEKAAAAGATRGSNTYQNAQNALSLGLLDNKALGILANRIPVVGQFTGPALEGLRKTATETKAKRLAGLLSDSGQAAQALEGMFNPRWRLPDDVGLLGYRAFPALVAD